VKNIICLAAILFAINGAVLSQKQEVQKHIVVPRIVKSSLYKKYPAARMARRITWGKENDNYEANWGGKESEANSVQYKPDGTFVEMVQKIPVNQLPELVIVYINKHYKEVKITKAGKITDAEGNLFYKTEIKERDLLFDENGKFVKAE